MSARTEDMPGKKCFATAPPQGYAGATRLLSASILCAPLSATMNDVTQILNAVHEGNPHAAEQLLPLVYEELRRLAAQRLAQEPSGQTLQPTALVHEAYVRLVASGDASAPREQHWDSRGHFFAAAEAMRRILIDNARRKQRPKHGGG